MCVILGLGQDLLTDWEAQLDVTGVTIVCNIQLSLPVWSVASTAGREGEERSPGAGLGPGGEAEDGCGGHEQ